HRPPGLPTAAEDAGRRADLRLGLGRLAHVVCLQVGVTLGTDCPASVGGVSGSGPDRTAGGMTGRVSGKCREVSGGGSCRSTRSGSCPIRGAPATWTTWSSGYGR